VGGFCIPCPLDIGSNLRIVISHLTRAEIYVIIVLVDIYQAVIKTSWHSGQRATRLPEYNVGDPSLVVAESTRTRVVGACDRISGRWIEYRQ
jgi:hypothetical protein